MPSIGPRELAAAHHIVAIDIRPMRERVSELGFMPGSLSMPTTVAGYAAAVERYRAGGEQVALYCNSGARSGRLLEELTALGGPAPLHLEGGLLGWLAVGLPTARVQDAPLEETDRAVEDLISFRRTLMACFVAEAVTVEGEPPVSADPLEALSQCYRDSGLEWRETDPERLLEVVDRASLLFRRLGGPLDRIAENVSRMYAILLRLRGS